MERRRECLTRRLHRTGPTAVHGYIGSATLALVAAQTEDLEVGEVVQATIRQRDDVVHAELLGGVRQHAVPRTDATVAGDMRVDRFLSHPAIACVVAPSRCT